MGGGWRFSACNLCVAAIVREKVRAATCWFLFPDRQEEILPVYRYDKGEKFSVLIFKDYRETRARIFKHLRSPRIGSKKSIPLAYTAWRADMTILFLLGS